MPANSTNENAALGQIEPALCHLCGCRPAGSREHLPGVGAANDGPVTVRYFQSAEATKDRRVLERVEADGFIVRTLCSHCNSRTGGSYGAAYKEFVEKFSASGVIDAGQARTWVNLEGIQPLRVLKQMTSMFIAAQGLFKRELWRSLCHFVLQRDARLESAPKLRYYLYRNASINGRVTALTSMMSIYRRWPPIMLAEISWPPVGIVFAMEPHPLLATMKDITDWGQYRFKDRASLQFSVPQLRVATHWPLGFGDERQAHAWSARDGVVALLHTGVGSNDATEMSVLTQRARVALKIRQQG